MVRAMAHPSLWIDAGENEVAPARVVVVNVEFAVDQPDPYDVAEIVQDALNMWLEAHA